MQNFLINDKHMGEFEKKQPIESRYPSLYSLVKEKKGSIEEISSLPGDLTVEHGAFVKPEHFQEDSAAILRMDFPGGTTVLALPLDERKPSGLTSYCADIYRDGEYQGGNHDLSLDELRRNIDAQSAG